MTGTSNNPRTLQPQDLTVLSDTDALRERCIDLLKTGRPDIRTAVAAVSAYASAFTAGIPFMVMPNCPSPGCSMCSLHLQNEISKAKQFVALFLEDIEYLCQRAEDSDDPEVQRTAEAAMSWVEACRSIPLPDRYQVLAPLVGMPDRT